MRWSIHFIALDRLRMIFVLWWHHPEIIFHKQIGKLPTASAGIIVDEWPPGDAGVGGVNCRIFVCVCVSTEAYIRIDAYTLTTRRLGGSWHVVGNCMRFPFAEIQQSNHSPHWTPVAGQILPYRVGALPPPPRWTEWCARMNSTEMGVRCVIASNF